MPLTIEHRPDNWLQKNAKRGKVDEKRLQHFFAVDQPHQQATLAFLQQNIIGKEFSDEAALRVALDDWPNFARQQGLRELNEAYQYIQIGERYIFFLGLNLTKILAIGVINHLASFR